MWEQSTDELRTIVSWTKDSARNQAVRRGKSKASQPERDMCNELAARIRIFSFEPSAISAPVSLVPHLELERSGRGLAGVLDRLRDEWPERFEALNSELGRWLPEFDRVVFNVPGEGMRGFGLRRKSDGQSLYAYDLSGGTLFAVALVTLAHLPNPPSIVGLEEPDHGMHPRLLRKVQDAIYRLAYPSDHREQRRPTQVILTTHSPHFLDLFKDHPEEVIVANKNDKGVTFQRLTDRPRMDEILPEGPLGDLWYSGLLGGVPAEPVQP
jgi:predicted ATPase